MHSLTLKLAEALYVVVAGQLSFDHLMGGGLSQAGQMSFNILRKHCATASAHRAIIAMRRNRKHPSFAGPKGTHSRLRILYAKKCDEHISVCLDDKISFGPGTLTQEYQPYQPVCTCVDWSASLGANRQISNIIWPGLLDSYSPTCMHLRNFSHCYKNNKECINDV